MCFQYHNPTHAENVKSVSGSPEWLQRPFAGDHTAHPSGTMQRDTSIMGLQLLTLFHEERSEGTERRLESADLNC